MAEPEAQPAEAPQSVTVVSPLGAIGTVPADQVDRALAQGYALADEERIAQEQRAREYGTLGHAALAGLAGAARGLTAGVSDALITGIGGEGARQALEAYEEVHPGISTVGELGGTVGGLLLSGGASGAARGAGAVAEGASLAARGAQAAELAAGGAEAVAVGARAAEGASLLGRGARVVAAPTRAILGAGEVTEQLAARYLTSRAFIPQVARAAVEGAGFELGHAISDSAIHDTELTGEKVLAALGGGALMGGGMGLGFAGAAAALGGAGKLLKRAITRPTADAVEGVLAKAGAEVAPGIGRTVSDAYSSAAALVSGGERNAIAELTAFGKAGAVAREEAFNATEHLARAGDDITSALERAVEARNIAADTFTGARKSDAIGQLVKRGNELETAAVARQHVAEMRQGLDDMLARKGEFGFRDSLKDIRDRVKIAEARIDAAERAAAQGGETFNRDAFMELDDLKRDLGKARRVASKKKVVTSADQATKRWLESTYEQRLMPTLENTELWGAAAESQARINAPWSQHIDVAKKTGGLFKSKEVGKWGETTMVLDREKVGGIIEGLANPNKADAVRKLEAWLDTADAFVREAGESAVMSTAEKAAVRDMKAAADAVRTNLGEAKRVAARAVQAEALRTAGAGGFGGALIGGLANAVGGPLGVGVGAVLGALANPHAMAQKLYAVERFAQKIEGKLGASIGQLAGRAARVSVYAPQRVGRPVINALEEQNRRVERYDRRAKRARQLAAVDASTGVQAALAPVRSAAPGMVDAAQAAARRSLDYVNAQLLPHGVRPTSDEAARIERKLRAQDDPTTLVRDLRDRKVTPEAIEAVKAVYPALYEDIRKRLGAEVARLESKGKRLPYVDRVNTSLVLGEPVDHTMIPSVLRAIQAGYAAQVPQDKPNRAPNIAAAFETESAKVARGG